MNHGIIILIVFRFMVLTWLIKNITSVKQLKECGVSSVESPRVKDTLTSQVARVSANIQDSLSKLNDNGSIASF
jgi:hypothetical protein